MTRVAVGDFLRETNSFAPTKATRDDLVHGGGAMPADSASLPTRPLRPGMRIKSNGRAFMPPAKSPSISSPTG
jgi:microcystin degradation protein MlrC